MKKPDEFELFHQRRKRRPLGEITNANNIYKRQPDRKHKEKIGLPAAFSLDGSNLRIRIKHGSRNPDLIHDRQSLIHDRQSNRILSGNTVTEKLSKDSVREAKSKHKNQENVTPLVIKDTKKSATSTFGNSGLSEKAKSFLKSSKSSLPLKNQQPNPENLSGKTSSRIPITKIRQLVSLQNESRPGNQSDEHISKIPLIKSFNSTSSRSSEPNARYKLLQSLVDYNAPVEKSNHTIRSFFDQMRLTKTTPNLSNATTQNNHNLLNQAIRKNCTTLRKVTKLGPFLWAATTTKDEEILLMDTHESQIGAGSKLMLENFHVHELAGSTTKAYYKWQVL